MAYFIISFSSIPRKNLEDVKYYVNELGESISLESFSIGNIDVALSDIHAGWVEWTIDRNSGIGVGDTVFVVCSSTSNAYMRSLRKTVRNIVSSEELTRLDDLCCKYDKYAGSMLFAGIVESIEDNPERIVYAKISPILGFDNPIPSNEYTSFITLNTYGSMTKIAADDYEKLLGIILKRNEDIDLSVIDKRFPSNLKQSNAISPETVNERNDLEKEIKKRNLIGEEKKAFVKIRINQGEYRKKLLKMYNHCCLCQVSDARLLIASHIKPWSDSNEMEKVDPYNGLLLCPNHDKLFDQGLITINPDKSITISSSLSQTDRVFMNISDDMKVECEDGCIEYFKYHRDNILIDI